MNPIAFSKNNWELILPPSPTTNQLVSLDFIDETTGWAVGEYGTILKTTDAGQSWRLIEIPELNYLRDVYFPIESVGYIVGDNGIILKSDNGGESWGQQPTRFTNDLYRVRFRDEEIGWIIGEKGLILYTCDGGINWQQQISNCHDDLQGLALIGDNTVCAVGEDSSLLITDDNGQIWQRKRFKAEGPNSAYYNFKDVFFLDEMLGWIGGYKNGEGIILKTMDGGDSWVEVQIDGADYRDFHSGFSAERGVGIQQIVFTDWRNGFCLTDAHAGEGASNIPLNVSIAGHKWFSRISGSQESSICQGRLVNLKGNGILNTGYRGEFRISVDSGLTWSFTNQSKRRFIYLFVGNHGQLVGRHCLGNDKYEWKYSNDYGKTWKNFSPQFIDSEGRIQKAMDCFYPWSVLDKNESLRTIGYVEEENSLRCYICESNDLSRTWHILGESVYLGRPFFVTPDTVIAYFLQNEEVSKNNYAWHLHFSYSYDGGQTVKIDTFHGVWNKIRIDSPFISNHYFLNGYTGFLIGSEGNIIKTVDAGRSWRNIPSGVVDALNDITFINQQIGFVVGKFGRILKTEDRGETWRKTDSGTQENILSIAFRNEFEGYAGTLTGIIETSNGGESWQRIPMRYFHGPIRKIHFDSDGTGYAFFYKFMYPGESRYALFPGGYISLLVLKEGGVQVATANQSSPYTFALYPNYPNPFNSRTVFRFSLLKNAAVSLTLYNIRGQRVCTLLDKSMESGEHEIIWNGVNQAGQAVASGVYLARLRRQGEVRTRKVVVLR